MAQASRARRELAEKMVGMPGDGMPGFDELPLRETADEDAKRLGRMGEAGIASAADPLGIPSAVLGLVSPEARDNWRAVQRQDGMGPQIVGGMATGLPAFGAIVKGGKTLLGAMGRSAGAATASDFVDAAAGKEGAVGKHTAIKALASQVGVAPAKAVLPAAGVLGASQIEFVPEAKAEGAAPLSADQIARRDALRARDTRGAASPLTKRERGELDGLNAQEQAHQNQTAKDERERRLQEERRKLAEKEAEGRRTSDRITAANKRYDDVLSDQPRGMRETKWQVPEWVPGVGGKTVDVGQTLTNLAPILPLVAGTVIGAKIGKTPDGAKLDAWKEALNRMEAKGASAGEYVAADATAKSMSKQLAGKAVPDGIVGRTATATGLGAVAGAATANAPEIVDLTRLDKNPRRVALEEKLKMLPMASKEYAETEALLKDFDAVPDKHPDWQRAMDHFNKGHFIPRTVGEAALGALDAGGTAFGRQMIPFLRNPPASLAAREDGIRAVTPEAVAARQAAMEALENVRARAGTESLRRSAGSDVDAAMIEADKAAKMAAAKTQGDVGAEFYSGDAYRGQIKEGLSSRQAAKLAQQQTSLEQQTRAAQAPRPTDGPEGGTGQVRTSAADAVDVPPPANPRPDAASGPKPLDRTSEVPIATGDIIPPVAAVGQGGTRLNLSPELEGDIRSLVRTLAERPAVPPPTTGRELAERIAGLPRARGREGQLDPYNTPISGPAGTASPADVTREIYMQASAAGKPTTGRGGNLTKDSFPDKVNQELATRTGVSDAAGLSREQLHKRRIAADQEISDLAKREGISYRDAVQRYYDANPLVETGGVKKGMRRNVPQLAIATGAGAGAASYYSGGDGIPRTPEELAHMIVMKQQGY